jgi:hypothetical protein
LFVNGPNEVGVLAETGKRLWRGVPMGPERKKDRGLKEARSAGQVLEASALTHTEPNLESGQKRDQQQIAVAGDIVVSLCKAHIPHGVPDIKR